MMETATKVLEPVDFHSRGHHAIAKTWKQAMAEGDGEGEGSHAIRDDESA